ncbi:MAG: hypothetical protein MJ025_03725 [Victivallaceae bacterium]|nr:hypothetical protein [Victivallaceae bacterium]
MKQSQTMTQVQGQQQKQQQVHKLSQQQLQQQTMLGLSAADLMRAINDARDGNCLLDVDSPEPGDVDFADDQEHAGDTDGGEGGSDEDGNGEGEDDDGDDETGGEEKWPTDEQFLADWKADDDDYSDDELSASERIVDNYGTLIEEWHSEVLSTPYLNDQERFVATAIVNDLSLNGMMETHLADIAMVCQVDMPVAERALAFVQSLSPAGVGARDVIEYFSLQLDRLSDPDADKTRTILATWRTLSEESMSELELAKDGADDSNKSNKDGSANEIDRIRAAAIKLSPAIMMRIRKATGLSDDDFHKGARLLSRLRRPGAGELEESDKLVPEVEILPDPNQKHKGRFVADYIPGPWSRLKVIEPNMINPKLDMASDKVKQYYKKKQESANGFKESINFRMDTVTALAQLIADMQAEYLRTKDKSKIVPISMKDAAAKLGLDASTISRAANDKLVRTPIGTMTIRELFTLSAPSRLSGNPKETPVTSDAIMEKVREVIESEPEGKPYSDQKIADILNERGINIALRTVTKYRNNLGIGNTSQRRMAPHR